MPDARIEDLPHEMTYAEMTALLATLVIGVDDPTFSAADADTQKLKLTTLLQDVKADITTLTNDKAAKTNVLTKDNTTEFNPTLDYHPATKKSSEAVLSDFIITKGYRYIGDIDDEVIKIVVSPGITMPSNYHVSLGLYANSIQDGNNDVFAFVESKTTTSFTIALTERREEFSDLSISYVVMRL